VLPTVLTCNQINQLTMSLHKKIERVQRMHNLIQYKRTGSPNQFAQKMNLSVRALYGHIKELKDLGAPIGYCSYRQSYQYMHPVEFRIGFIPPSIAEKELRAINGGGAVVRNLTVDLAEIA